MGSALDDVDIVDIHRQSYAMAYEGYLHAALSGKGVEGHLAEFPCVIVAIAVELAVGSYEFTVFAACGHGDVVVVAAILCGGAFRVPVLAEEVECEHGVLHRAHIDCGHHQAALAIVGPLAGREELHHALVWVSCDEMVTVSPSGLSSVALTAIVLFEISSQNRFARGLRRF